MLLQPHYNPTSPPPSLTHSNHLKSQSNPRYLIKVVPKPVPSAEETIRPLHNTYTEKSRYCCCFFKLGRSKMFANLIYSVLLLQPISSVNCLHFETFLFEAISNVLGWNSPRWELFSLLVLQWQWKSLLDEKSRTVELGESQPCLLKIHSGNTWNKNC